MEVPVIDLSSDSTDESSVKSTPPLVVDLTADSESQDSHQGESRATAVEASDQCAKAGLVRSQTDTKFDGVVPAEGIPSPHHNERALPTFAEATDEVNQLVIPRVKLENLQEHADTAKTSGDSEGELLHQLAVHTAELEELQKHQAGADNSAVPPIDVEGELLHQLALQTAELEELQKQQTKSSAIQSGDVEGEMLGQVAVQKAELEDLQKHQARAQNSVTKSGDAEDGLLHQPASQAAELVELQRTSTPPAANSAMQSSDAEGVLLHQLALQTAELKDLQKHQLAIQNAEQEELQKQQQTGTDNSNMQSSDAEGELLHQLAIQKAELEELQKQQTSIDNIAMQSSDAEGELLHQLAVQRAELEKLQKLQAVANDSAVQSGDAEGELLQQLLSQRALLKDLQTQRADADRTSFIGDDTRIHGPADNKAGKEKQRQKHRVKHQQPQFAKQRPTHEDRAESTLNLDEVHDSHVDASCTIGGFSDVNGYMNEQPTSLALSAMTGSREASKAEGDLHCEQQDELSTNSDRDAYIKTRIAIAETVLNAHVGPVCVMISASNSDPTGAHAGLAPPHCDSAFRGECTRVFAAAGAAAAAASATSSATAAATSSAEPLSLNDSPRLHSSDIVLALERLSQNLEREGPPLSSTWNVAGCGGPAARAAILQTAANRINVRLESRRRNETAFSNDDELSAAIAIALRGVEAPFISPSPPCALETNPCLAAQTICSKLARLAPSVFGSEFRSLPCINADCHRCSGSFLSQQSALDPSLHRAAASVAISISDDDDRSLTQPACGTQTQVAGLKRSRPSIGVDCQESEADAGFCGVTAPRIDMRSDHRKKPLKKKRSLAVAALDEADSRPGMGTGRTAIVHEAEARLLDLRANTISAAAGPQSETCMATIAPPVTTIQSECVAAPPPIQAPQPQWECRHKVCFLRHASNPSLACFSTEAERNTHEDKRRANMPPDPGHLECIKATRAAIRDPETCVICLAHFMKNDPNFAKSLGDSCTTSAAVIAALALNSSRSEASENRMPAALPRSVVKPQSAMSGGTVSGAGTEGVKRVATELAGTLNNGSLPNDALSLASPGIFVRNRSVASASKSRKMSVSSSVMEGMDSATAVPITLPTGETTLLKFVRCGAEADSFTKWKTRRCSHVLCPCNGRDIQHPILHACESLTHVACITHFGPKKCQACHLLFLALQVATATALPVRPSGNASPPCDIVAGDSTWKAAKNLRAYAGVAFLIPEGPVISQVLQAVRERAVLSPEHPGWVDRLQDLRCLHETTARTFYARHHAEIFVPLLQLTGLPATPVREDRRRLVCQSPRSESCLGCLLEEERQSWVLARIERAKVDEELRRDDTKLHKSLPRKMQCFAEAVAPLMAAMPPEFAERIASVMGVVVDVRAVQALPSSPHAADAPAASPSPFAAVWQRATLPASASLDSISEVWALGRPSS